MVRYRRHLTPGATYFITATLADRGASHLTTQIEALREAFRQTRAERPFTIDAIVILPDHLHALLTLPEHDADLPHRVRRIKTLVTRPSSTSATTSPPETAPAAPSG